MDSFIGAGRLSTERTAHLGTLLGPIRYIHIGPILIAVKVRQRNWTKDDTDYVPKLVEPLAEAMVPNPDWHLKNGFDMLAEDWDADLTGSFFEPFIGHRDPARLYVIDGTGSTLVLARELTDTRDALRWTTSINRDDLFDAITDQKRRDAKNTTYVSAHTDSTTDITGLTVQIRGMGALWFVTEGTGEMVQLSDYIPGYYTGETPGGQPEETRTIRRSELAGGDGVRFA